MKVKIGVLGGTSCSEEAELCARMIGGEIIRADCVLYTGGVEGVGESAVNGALERLGDSDSKRINESIVQILPAWSDQRIVKESERGTIINQGRNWSDRQKILVDEIDCGISISGGGGTANEIRLIKESGKPFIAIAGEGASDDESDRKFSHNDESFQRVVTELLNKGIKKGEE